MKDIFKFSTQIIFPEKVILSNGINEESKLIERETVNYVMSDPEYVVCEKNSFIVFDFGKEICGKIRISFNFCQNTGNVRIRLGESVSEACSELGENNSGNNHSVRDFIYPVVCNGEIFSFESGFRFARVDFFEETRINCIYAEAIVEAHERIGTFCCDDDLINKIYQTAVDTLALCVKKGTVWDGVKRDRAVWIGDFNPEMHTALCVYGNISEYKAVLDTVKRYTNSWVNFIPSYSAWWLICLYDFYLYVGDKDYVIQNIKYINKIIEDFDKIFNDDGSVDFERSKLEIFEENEYFFDWPTNFKKDRMSAWRSLIIFSLKKARILLKELSQKTEGVDAVIKKCEKISAEDSSFKQVVAMNYLSGRYPREKTKIALERGGAVGLSCFMNYYIFKAMAEVDVENVLEIIKEYYGAMLDLGATTFFEDFDIEWTKDNPSRIFDIPKYNIKNIHADYGKFCYKGFRHSLCHGWASGIAAFLSETVLGVKILKNGFECIKVEPKLFGLTFAEGTIPTPFGDIYIKHEKVNNKIISVVKVPDGVIVK